MEIYKETTSQNEKFKKLLLDTFSKTKIEEGKILQGKITKVTAKQAFILIPGILAK